jgi:hypothetical protein
MNNVPPVRFPTTTDFDQQHNTNLNLNLNLNHHSTPIEAIIISIPMKQSSFNPHEGIIIQSP